MARNEAQKVGIIPLDDYQPPSGAIPSETETPAPVVDETVMDAQPVSSEDGFIPLDVQPEQTMNMEPPVGIGPLASGEEYARAHPMGQELEQGYGFGTVARSAAETAMPFTNELTAKAYAAAYPELTEDQWYKVLTEREKQYSQENPIMAPVSNIAGAGLMAAPVIAGGTMAGIPAAAGTLGAMGYGIATAPFVSQKRADEPGYQAETAVNTAVGAMAPVAGPAMVSAITAIPKLGAKIGGRMFARVMSMTAKDPETAMVYKNWLKDPGKYTNISDPKQARTELYNEMSDALNLLKSEHENKRMTLKDVEAATRALKQDYMEIMGRLESRAKELGEPPSGTAEQIEKNFRDFKDRVYSLYDEAWDRAPSAGAWQDAPQEYGLPIEDYARSMFAAVSKNLENFSGPEKEQIAKKVGEILRYNVGEMVDDALKSKVISPEVHTFFKANQDLLQTPSAFLGAINNPENARALSAFGTSPQELVDAYRYISFINPQTARKFSGSLFKRSSGFKSMSDQMDPTANILNNEIGEKIFGDWRGIWLDSLKQKPFMKEWADQNQIAYHMNTNFLKPLEDRFAVRGASREATKDAFVRAAQDTEDQILNSLRMASMVRGRMDQNLVDLAGKLRAAKMSAKSLRDLDFNTAIKRIAEKDELADDTLSALSQLDPQFRAQFAELEKLALDAKDNTYLYKTLAKEAEEFAKKNKPALGWRYGSVEAAVNKLGTGRHSNVNMAGARTDAEEGVKNLMNFMANGDESAANQALQRLRNLREIGLLDKRQTRGSRETIQASSLGTIGGGLVGAATGTKIPPFAGAAAGVVANTVADRFTNGKWSNMTPWIIEKMMNTKVMKYRAGMGRGLMSGVISREIGDGGALIEILPNSPEAAQAIAIIMGDKGLTPREKTQAVKKINEEGIIIE